MFSAITENKACVSLEEEEKRKKQEGGWRTG
jgi:hypothetical protein